MKSSELANVITRRLSSFGTGKRYFRMLFTCERTQTLLLNLQSEQIIRNANSECKGIQDWSHVIAILSGLGTNKPSYEEKTRKAATIN
jgi:hypothetical protein